VGALDRGEVANNGDGVLRLRDPAGVIPPSSAVGMADTEGHHGVTPRRTSPAMAVLEATTQRGHGHRHGYSNEDGDQPGVLRCCCGRDECVFLRHNCSVLLSVERDVHAAAKMGQVSNNEPCTFRPNNQVTHAPFVQPLPGHTVHLLQCRPFFVRQRLVLPSPLSLFPLVPMLARKHIDHDPGRSPAYLLQ